VYAEEASTSFLVEEDEAEDECSECCVSTERIVACAIENIQLLMYVEAAIHACAHTYRATCREALELWFCE